MSDVKRWPTGDELAAMSVAERSQYVREHTAVAIAALPTAKRLLLGATPLPWAQGFWSGQCHIEAHGNRHPGGPECQYDPVFVDHSIGIASRTPDADVISSSHEGLEMGEADAALIVYAVNALPDYETLTTAFESLDDMLGNDTVTDIAWEEQWAEALGALHRLGRGS